MRANTDVAALHACGEGQPGEQACHAEFCESPECPAMRMCVSPRGASPRGTSPMGARCRVVMPTASDPRVRLTPSTIASRPWRDEDP